MSTGFNSYLKLIFLLPVCPVCILLPPIPFSLVFFTLLCLLEQAGLYTSLTAGLESCALKRLNANASSPDFTGCGFNLAARVQGVLQQHKPHLYPLHLHTAVSALFCLCRNTANFSMTLCQFFSRDSFQTCFSHWDDHISASVRISVSLLLDQTNSP